MPQEQFLRLTRFYLFFTNRYETTLMSFGACRHLFISLAILEHIICSVSNRKWHYCGVSPIVFREFLSQMLNKHVKPYNLTIHPLQLWMFSSLGFTDTKQWNSVGKPETKHPCASTYVHKKPLRTQGWGSAGSAGCTYAEGELRSFTYIIKMNSKWNKDLFHSSLKHRTPKRAFWCDVRFHVVLL